MCYNIPDVAPNFRWANEGNSIPLPVRRGLFSRGIPPYSREVGFIRYIFGSIGKPTGTSSSLWHASSSHRNYCLAWFIVVWSIWIRTHTTLWLYFQSVVHVLGACSSALIVDFYPMCLCSVASCSLLLPVPQCFCRYQLSTGVDSHLTAMMLTVLHWSWQQLFSTLTPPA